MTKGQRRALPEGGGRREARMRMRTKGNARTRVLFFAADCKPWFWVESLPLYEYLIYFYISFNKFVNYVLNGNSPHGECSASTGQR